MHRTNIYLEERQSEILDRLAAERGVSRAELVREFIDHGVQGGQRDRGAALAAIRESAGIAPDFPFPERSDGDRRRYLETLRGRAE